MNIKNKTAYDLYIEDEAKKEAVPDRKKLRKKWNRNRHIRNYWYIKEDELLEEDV